MNRKSRQRYIWFYPLVVIGGASIFWFGLVLGIDLLLMPEAHSVGLAVGLGRLFSVALTGIRADAVQNVLSNLPEVVVAILSVAITVVSIIVQLAATRYTPRVTEIFFRDRANLLVLGFFVVTSLHCVWATLAVRQGFLPRVLVTSTIGMITVSLLVLVPYFMYVFAILEPERVVYRLRAYALAKAVEGRRGNSAHEVRRQAGVLDRIEQLADVAVNAISQKDRIIASRSVDALKELVCAYLEHKGELPEDWFVVGPELVRNPDFMVMAADRVAQISSSRSWMEWKVLRQYQTIYNEAINRMRDISELIAINTRSIGEMAQHRDDRAVWALSVKFFNTFLRATINRGDVRSAYNTLHQYRLLAEGAIRCEATQDVLELAGYFRYYGQLANSAGLSFVTETAAHDLGSLCEVAHSEQFSRQEDLLRIFLDVDKRAETAAEERSLRGVRKAQVKLATYYLEAGAEPWARLIWADMERENPERLASIRDEMMEVKDVDFWEVIDRGYNFDYLTPSRREQLDRFYGWFGTELA